MRVRALSASLAAVAVCCAVPAAASARTVTATSGEVTATLASRVAGGDVRTSLRVTRGGATSAFGGLAGGGGYGLAAIRPLRIRDLDADGEPEVLAELYSGGAHCCTRSAIATWDPASSTYRVQVRDWGDAFFALRDIGGDGHVELRSVDERWAYWGGPYAFGAFPVRIWALRAGVLTDVTRAFPAVVRADRARHWLAYVAARREREPYRGALAGYVADSHLLGRAQADAAWRRIYRADRARGRLRFFRALAGKLLATGYRTAAQTPPPVAPR